MTEQNLIKLDKRLTELHGGRQSGKQRQRSLVDNAARNKVNSASDYGMGNSFVNGNDNNYNQSK